MSTKSKTLAKSLHTVSALVSVAKLFRDLDKTGTETPAEWVALAARTLGYADAADPYNLIGQAIAKL